MIMESSVSIEFASRIELTSPPGGLTNTPAFNRIFDNPDANILSTMVAIYEV